MKRWPVLVPERLLFYEKECPTIDNMPKSEFMLKEATKVLSWSSYKGANAKFNVSKPPLSVCEIATNDSKESCAWISQIQQQIQNSPTPVQTLLLERYRIREEYKRKKDDIMDKLNKIFGTSKGGGLDAEEDIIYGAIGDNIATEEAKLKAVFMKLDLDGNGLL